MQMCVVVHEEASQSYYKSNHFDFENVSFMEFMYTAYIFYVLLLIAREVELFNLL